MKVSFAFLALFFFTDVFSQPCNMQGVYKIGPGGAYTTIAAAMTALRTNGLGGPAILEIKSNYSFISEAGLTFSGIPCISATNTITLRPETGATNVIIASSFSIILLNNSKYIIIDGRPGGAGTTSQLNINCSGAATNAIQFGTNSSDNIIQYVNITGNNTGATNGAVAFLTGGCTNNIIRNCRLSGNGNGNPLICIYAESNTTKNTNNKIQDCAFTGFFPQTSTGTAHGIFLGKNNENWEITGNSFYQDIATPQMGTGYVNAITINDTTSANYIAGNYIGGTAPLCGGIPYLMDGRFNGILVAAGKDNYTHIINNTIRNINWKMSTSSGGIEGFAAIHIASGKVDCGTIGGNTIGSMSQNESITITSFNGDLSRVAGILVGYNPYNIAITDTVLIKNNQVGGIRSVVAPSNFQGAELRGINVAEQRAGYIDISNNTIGSPTLTNSLYSALSTNGKVVGIDFHVSSNGPIWSDTYPIANRIADNKISHFYGTTTGIQVNGGKPQVLNNIISDMSMAVLDGAVLSIYCIKAGQCTGGSLIQGNHCYNLSLYPQQGSGIAGITLDLCTGVEVSKNFLHNFQVLSATGTAIVTGIDVSSFFTNKISIINNMISLGIDSTGFAFPQLSELTGINITIDTSIVTHNSVYIAGSGDRDANALYLTKRNNSVCRVTDNILVNVHSQSTPNVFSYNCGVKFDPIFNTTLNGLVLSNNLYKVNGLGSFIGSYNNSRYATLPAWQAAISNDNNSLEGDPNFIAPADNGNSTNLHIQLPTPADAAGVLEAAVTTDIDGQQRSLLTPVDIGADAISSTPLPGIASFSPTSAAAGATITITGTNFTGATAVSFGGIAAASFTVVNATTITAVVGSGATGNVSITTPGGTTNRTGFTFIAAPTITSFTPASAPTGSTVTITGTNFAGATSVSFGGTAASSFTVVNATTVTAVVGTGATGNVSVTTPGGTAIRAGFTFIAAPTITSFTPVSASTGSTVTITGTNFTGATSVSFGGTAASSFTVVNATSITAVIGAGATGNVNITTPGGTASIPGFTYNVVTSVGNVNSNSVELQVSPNPANDMVSVTHPASVKTTYLKLIDINGRLIKLLIPARNSAQTLFSVKGVAAGLYKIIWTDGKKYYRRTVIITQ